MRPVHKVRTCSDGAEVQQQQSHHHLQPSLIGGIVL